MTESSSSRRDFLKATSGAVAAAAAPPKILNHNPKMTYRPLGRTGFQISEIALGGHGGKTVEDRVPVLEKAVELGMNYVDNNIDAECELYGAAMAKSGSAGRDKWFIGFASWPEKLTPDYEAELREEGMMKNIEARLKSYRTDVLDLWRPVGATWGPGQRNVETLMAVSDKVLDMVVKVYEKARAQGKVRHLGLSAHNPKVFRNVLANYPQFEVIIFPYLFLTQEMGGDSLLNLAAEKKVGVIGLKPFAAGATFNIRPNQISGKLDERAHVLVKEMLQERRIAAVIPGVNSVEQLVENVKGSYEKDRAFTEDEKLAFRECLANYREHLPAEYRWLHHWHRV